MPTYSASIICASPISSSENEVAKVHIFPSLTPMQDWLYTSVGHSFSVNVMYPEDSQNICCGDHKAIDHDEIISEYHIWRVSSYRGETRLLQRKPIETVKQRMMPSK